MARSVLGDVFHGRLADNQLPAGSYFFLDWSTLEHYNHHRTSDWAPSLEDESEAVGDCMRLNLKLLPPGQLPTAPDPTGEFEFDFDASDDDSDSDDSEDEDYGGSAAAPKVNKRQESTPPTPLPDNQDSVGSTGESGTNVPPTLSFIGTSQPLHFSGTFSNISHMSSNRSIRGTVRMTKEGQVHW